MYTLADVGQLGRNLSERQNYRISTLTNFAINPGFNPLNAIVALI